MMILMIRMPTTGLENRWMSSYTSMGIKKADSPMASHPAHLIRNNKPVPSTNEKRL
jgi:hypothetical protein